MKFVMSAVLAKQLGPENIDWICDAMKAAAEEESGREHEWSAMINRDALVLHPKGCNDV